MEEIPEWAKRCPSGKIKWASAADARRAYRQKRSTATKAFKGTVHVYRCGMCGAFHTTSTRPRKGR